MGPHNSQFDVIYVDIMSNLLLSDPLNTSETMSKRDIETLRSRYHSEGISFLTKTLPKLGKALDQALVNGRLEVPREFKRSVRNRSIPAFMQAYFSLLFDGSGAILEDACPKALRHLRQVLFTCYKLELPYTRAQENVVINNFLQAEIDLSNLGEFPTDVIDKARELTSEVFAGFDPVDIRPRHGPGAVSTGEKLEEKYDFKRIYPDLESVYPFLSFFTTGSDREHFDRVSWMARLNVVPRGIAKVVLVPKDSRGPRLISAEPLEFQWIQQGLGRKIMRHLESHKLTKGHVNFSSQQVNRTLAQQSSVDRRFATLDLQEASDRVSLRLVQEVFGLCPELLASLEATRTRATYLPDGRVVELQKFAPMGSALCFPIESFTFWVLIVAFLQTRFRYTLHKAVKSVYVYGDDIIIPTHLALEASAILEAFGLKVNRNKSCFRGNFRESCGKDAFKGIDVTPLRLKTLWTGKDSDGGSYASYASFAREIRKRGYIAASDFIYRRIRHTYGSIPYGVPESPYHCIEVDTVKDAIALNRAAGIPVRYNSAYQRVEVRAKLLIPKKRGTDLDGWPRLLRYLTGSAGERPSETVIPRSVQLKPRWMALIAS